MSDRSGRPKTAAPNLRRRGIKAVQTSADDTDSAPAPVSVSATHAEPGKPNPYPHRLSVDVDTDTYRALRLIAAQEGCRLVDVVRAGIVHELNIRQQVPT